MIRSTAVIWLCMLLSACTLFYAREYVADTPQKMSAAEAEQVFRAFREFLIAKGLNPQRYGDKVESDRVTFRIGGSNAGFGLRNDREDLLELSYSGGDGFRLRLMRIVHHPADFSDEYLKQFVEQSEEFLRLATGKPIRLTLISPKSR
jgi:hypothetical protein